MVPVIVPVMVHCPHAAENKMGEKAPLLLTTVVPEEATKQPEGAFMGGWTLSA